MSLSAGTRLGPYEILALIGSGGMGEVYRARDMRLHRTVAIKVSTAQFSERFEREARAVAALNHPNICTLYDVGPNYLVMEFIDGQTLYRMIPASGMRLADVLRIVVRIADGLAAAHALGIIHRDLKPGNVMVTAAGAVKLLDFGLAATEESSLPSSESTSTRTVVAGPKTTEGTIVGTVSYMSPEQAEGRKLDARSDIFSFGSVLYEMITGQRAFRGDTTISTLAAILNQEPKPPAELVAWLPADLERIVSRCLRKDPDRRFQHASDLRVELQELVDAQSSGTLTAVPAARATARPRRHRFWTPAPAALAFIAGISAGWMLHRSPPPFQGPTLTRATYDSGLTCDPALSLDGRLLAYASDRAGKGNLDIWVQPAGGGDPVQLTHDDADESEPSFSPDGSQVVYRSERDGGGIYVISALGGESRLIAREGRTPRFSPNGSQIAYWTGKGGRSEALARQGGRLFIVPADGGEPRHLATQISQASTPVWSPDGRTLLFVGLIPGSRSEYTWFLTPAAEDRPIQTNAAAIFATDNMPSPSQWLPSNKIVFAEHRTDGANLYRVGIDAASAKLSGKAERITFGGGVENAPSLAANGTPALADLTWNFDLWSLPIDTRSAHVNGQPVRLTESLTAEILPSLSGDGRKLSYVAMSPQQYSIWVLDLGSGKSIHLLSLPGECHDAPAISRDGSTVAYGQLRDKRYAMFTIPSSGGSAQRVCDDCGTGISWTTSGKIVHRSGFERVAVLDAKTRDDRILLESDQPPYQTSFSPDERMVTFIQIPSPQTAKIVVAPATGTWPIPKSEWISVTDGTAWDDKPRWSPDGNLLYFTSERDRYRCLWAQRLEPRTRRPTGAPFAVAHFHSSRRSMFNVGIVPLELALGPDRIVFVQGEVTGNIWLAHLP